MIKTFTVINSITNQPVRYCQCIDADKDLLCGENEYLVEGRQEAENDSELFTSEFKDFRNALLAESDWTQFADSPLTDKKKSEWATYRQALRDLPQEYPNAISNDDIIWPTKPR